MKPELLEFLVCVHCGAPLRCAASRMRGAEVEEGMLDCTQCAARFPVRGGIPRMLPDGLSTPECATSRAFGTQWKMLADLTSVFREEFRSYFDPLAPTDLNGLAVLDAGCGMGKFSYAAAEAGARVVIGVDLSEAVEVAHAHLRDRPNAHVVQASIYQLPFRPSAFEFVFSIGVLHHLPDPALGFERLVRLVHPGGRILVWLYALEGNERFVRLLDPWRARLFSRLPPAANRVIATVLAVPLWLLIRGLYVPLARRERAGRLPYAPYFLYFHRLGFQVFWGTVYDKLVPPIAHYLSQGSVRRWLENADLTELALRHRNANSWTCLARRCPPA